MAENYKKDGLEDFFRKRLEGFEEPPKPDMWDKIAFNMPPKPPLVWWKRPIWWIGSAMMIGLVVFYWQLIRINQFKTIIHQQEETISTLQASHNEAEESIPVIEEVVPSQWSEAQNENVPVSIHSIAPGTGRKDKAVNIGKATPPITYATPPYDIEKEEGREKLVTAEAEADSMADLENINAAPLSEKLNMHALESTNMFFLPSALYSIDQKPNISDKKEIEFYLAVQTGIMGASFDGGLSKENAMTPNSGSGNGYALSWAQRTQLDVLAGLQLTRRWSVELGLGLRRNNLAFLDSQSITYSDDLFNSLNAMGEPTGTHDNETITAPTIAYQLVNHVENDGEDIQEGEFFELDAAYTYFMQYVSIPLWVKYRMGKRRLHTFLKTGVSWNILSRNAYTWKSPSVSFERIKLEKVEVKDDGIRERYFEFGAAAGLEFDINVANAIGLETTYYRSLSPVLGNEQKAFGMALNYKHRF